MALPFLNFMTHEIPFSGLDNALSDEGYPAPRSKSVGYAQPYTIPEPIRTDLVSLVSPLEYQMFTYISTSQNVRNSERFGDLPSGGITFPGIDVTDATALPIYPDLEIDFRGLETGSTQGSTPSLVGQTAPDYGADSFDITGLDDTLRSCRPHWQPQEDPTMAQALLFPTQTLVVPETDSYGDWGIGGNEHQANYKRVKRVVEIGVLEAAGPSSRARHKPAARIPTSVNGKSKTAGHGAGMLVAPTAHEVYHQSLPGPSVQRELVWPTAPETLPWVEGSAEGDAWHHNSMGVPKQDVMAEHEEQTGGGLFRIPRGLKERHRTLLATTDADWKRGAVDVLKCRLCPGADFSDFDDFKRHCDKAEAHPAKISFCDRCGDFFARGDALVRHKKKPPTECTSVAQDEAKLKRRITEEVYEGFMDRLALWMRTGEGLGKPKEQSRRKSKSQDGR
ncbi:hypothetical protein BGW80DRAFT_1357098 [Lactifluus volemus]|nr:hypothetical protein BGW80DRAFT_1357098 [Lactifluus volemus]